jgi:hypothetical protein
MDLTEAQLRSEAGQCAGGQKPDSERDSDLTAALFWYT